MYAINNNNVPQGGEGGRGPCSAKKSAADVLQETEKGRGLPLPNKLESKDGGSTISLHAIEAASVKNRISIDEPHVLSFKNAMTGCEPEIQALETMHVCSARARPEI
jgi:hypothetical protein